MVQILRRCLRANLAQFRQARHRAVVVHDFADHADGALAGQVHQVHGGFGMAGALQDAAGPRAQRKHVAGLDQVLRHRRRRGHDVNRPRAVAGADARRDAVRGVHAHLKIGPEAFAVVVHHAVNAELLEPLGGGRHANQAAPEFGHKIHRRGGHVLAGDDEIAFVFAVFVVHHDDHFAPADFSNDGFDSVAGFFHSTAGSLTAGGKKVT